MSTKEKKLKEVHDHLAQAISVLMAHDLEKDKRLNKVLWSLVNLAESVHHEICLLEI